MNALQEKINRYKLYIVQDHALIEAHPTKTAYKNRLKNHQAKLNRLLEKQERKLNPPPYIEPPHHPGITFSEYEALEKEIAAYISELDKLGILYPQDICFTACLCNEDGGPVEWEDATSVSVSITDFDGQHDFDTLNDRLKTVGIEIPVHPAEIWEGDTVTAWGIKSFYGYDIPLKKINIVICMK